MRFTLSWLKQFLDTDASLEKVARTLTSIGLEVEDIDDKALSLAEFEVAKIIETIQHPEANKLKICQVQTKSGIIQVVCGASNARSGIKIVLANIGVLIPNGNFRIKESVIRGVASSGMICSGSELGLNDDSDGIIELIDNAIVGDRIAAYLGVDDPVIHINITPNRADALGVRGIARDLAASAIGELKKLTIPKLNQTFKSQYNLSVKNSDACPFFAVREIKGLQNKQSPKWLKTLLANIGIGSISAIVDVTNYICYSFGQPLHAYDASAIKDGLVVDIVSSECKIQALNGKEYLLQNGDIIIKDGFDVQCVAGIIGGLRSACSEKTTSILLEAASFNSEYIAKTGRRIALDTDSRYRFERNVDKSFALQALDLATEIITDICGGQVSELISYGSHISPSRYLNFPISFLHSRANLMLNSKEIIDILEKLGFICNLRNESIDIEIPSWRYDVSIKEDIVEEIMRIYGYDNIEQIPLPFSGTTKIIPDYQRRISDIKRLLASLGYNESVSWSFMDSKKAALFTTLKNELTLQNPINIDLDYMRPSILPNLLQICYNNFNRSFQNLSLFEVGPIFKDASEQVTNHAAGVRAGYRSDKNIHGDRRLYDIFDIKADISSIFKHIGLDLDKCQIKKNVPDYYHPTRSASICLGPNILGYFGAVHPTILKKFNIDTDILAFELDISALPMSKKKFGKRSEYVVSNYPCVTRDYAFIIDKSIAIMELLNFIKNIDKSLIRTVDLFDIYSDNRIESGKQSVALSVNMQDDNKTLSEDDIAVINKKIIDGMQKRFDAILRDN